MDILGEKANIETPCIKKGEISKQLVIKAIPELVVIAYAFCPYTSAFQITSELIVFGQTTVVIHNNKFSCSKSYRIPKSY